ncbi:proenkephalin b [Denticeps clupeoides]|uniref:Synenkephalin n=1 Tax=Denticeps clupeoides TaxID=299321 RepID=A0AAY4E1U5_9TELE|nr:proenkephalin-A-like [Denticeps clupeoides]
MAVPVTCSWTAVLGACLALTVSADCGADCASCAGHGDVSPTMCVLQCEGELSVGGSWGLCRDLLRRANGAEGDSVLMETKQQEAQLHPLEKKYGGFMKRYGGFMKRYGGFMKKSDELQPDDVDHGWEILTSRDLGDHENQEEALSLLRQLLSGKEGSEGVAKRYGGFMRRGGAYDSEGGTKPLQKRYGGFMRRVGRPEWLVEAKRYGGFLKRSKEEKEEDEDDDEEHEPEMEKRYGGFMGY